MSSRRWRTIPRWVRWGGAVVLLLLFGVVVLSVLDWNLLRPLVSRIASAKLSRPVRIDGNLRVRLLSSTPSVSVDGLAIGNPPWAQGDMLAVRHLQVAIELAQLLRLRLVIRTLELDQPQLSLLRQADGRANWEFSNAQGRQSDNQSPTKLPPIRHFALHGGRLDVDDVIRKLTFDGQVDANENSAHPDTEPFHLHGQGTLNKEPFKLTFEGGALLNIDVDKPYAFNASVDAGPSQASVKGSLAKPFDLSKLDADLDVQGQNLANLYYLTGLSLPLTPPYHLSAQVHRDDMHFELKQIVGKVGSSDLRGEAAVDIGAHNRPTLQATLESRSLNLGDLGVAFGAGVAPQSEQTGAPQLPAPQKQQDVSPYLMPTFEFQFDRLAAMDAAVSFHADSVQTQKVPFKAVSFKLKLKRGVLDIDPVDFELPLGKLAGTVHLDTQHGMPVALVDLRLSDVKLDQFKGKGPNAQPPLTGVLQSRLRLEGHGNSVHAMAADSNGKVTAIIPHGEIRRALAELTSINIVNGVGLLLSKSDEAASIRCGVAAFSVKDGDMHADRIVLDTQTVVVNGTGHINLMDEKLDLDIAGKPKKLRIGRLRTPINVRGTLEHPSVSISTPDAIKQGGIAAAAGALLTPFAAIIAFVDPGLAKDQDCSALINETEDKQATAPPPTVH